MIKKLKIILKVKNLVVGAKSIHLDQTGKMSLICGAKKIAFL